MAKPPALKPEQIKANTPMRIRLNSWEDYQLDLKDEATRKYVLVAVFRPTDTIIDSPTYAKVLWWDLLRLSAAGRRKGWVVMGKDDPITPKKIAHILNLDLHKEVIPGLKHHILEKRITIYSILSENISEYTEEQSQTPEDIELTSPLREGKLSEVKGSEDVVDLVSYYLQIMGKKSYSLEGKDGKKRKARIREVLKIYGLDDCKKMVDACKADKFHMGDNDRQTVYNDLCKHVFKDASKMEGWLESNSGKRRPQEGDEGVDPDGRRWYILGITKHYRDEKIND